MPTEQAIVKFTVAERDLYLRLEANGDALAGCWLLGSKPQQVTGRPANAVLRDAVQQLRAYFAGDTESLDLPLALSGTEFQRMVWDAAGSIPAGEVRSYTWLAQKCGNPRAVRAVASALGANPALLFVPCHRVLRSNGDLGGFSCGLEWKEVLLAHERVGEPELALA
jgi:O-6-methylguanine DNA methyltransferase